MNTKKTKPSRYELPLVTAMWSAVTIPGLLRYGERLWPIYLMFAVMGM